MARQLRVEFPGAIYHVTCRMIGDRRLGRSRLFLDDKDRDRFLERLSERLEQQHIRLYQFVLMTNHFHLVFETPEGNCSKFMHSLLTAYTVYYNRRHSRHGHLFDGRYKAKLVEGDEYLLALTRYVHLNPIHVGSVRKKELSERLEHLRNHKWSSYHTYVGKRPKCEFVESGPILAMMSTRRGSGMSAKQRAYREFVESAAAEPDDEFAECLKESPRSIGSDTFRVWVDKLYDELAGGGNVCEDIAFRRVTEPMSVDVILEAVAVALGVETADLKIRLRSSPLRGIAARMLIRFGGMTQREAATSLNMGTGGAVGAQVRRLPALLEKDRRLRRQTSLLEERLQSMRSNGAKC